MRRSVAIALALGLITCLAAAPLKVPNKGYATYRGAWFSIKYPAGFKVAPRQKSATHTAGYDAVSFLSPDGQAEFYIYSPQWRGNPEWIKPRTGERETSRSSEKADTKKITYVTLKAAGYTRSYADYRDSASNTRWVFGFRYSGAAAYAGYRPLYVKFKQSLRQYAD